MTVFVLVCVAMFAAGAWFGKRLAESSMELIIERFIKEMWAKRPRKKG